MNSSRRVPQASGKVSHKMAENTMASEQKRPMTLQEFCDAYERMSQAERQLAPQYLHLFSADFPDTEAWRYGASRFEESRNANTEAGRPRRDALTKESEDLRSITMEIYREIRSRKGNCEFKKLKIRPAARVVYNSDKWTGRKIIAVHPVSGESIHKHRLETFDHWRERTGLPEPAMQFKPKPSLEFIRKAIAPLHKLGH
jgi:hypothetical protein